MQIANMPCGRSKLPNVTWVFVPQHDSNELVGDGTVSAAQQGMRSEKEMLSPCARVAS